MSSELAVVGRAAVLGRGDTLDGAVPSALIHGAVHGALLP